MWSVSGCLLPLIMVLFPDGRVPSPRWRVGVWLSIGALVLSAVSSDGAFGPLLTGPRPLNTILGPEFGTAARSALALTVSPIVLLVALALGVAALVVRLRRARGEVLLQLKWFVYAAGVLVTVITIESILFAVPGLGLIGSDTPYPAAILWGVPWGLSLAALPLAAAFAILRYRLYDIDLLINRTLVYGDPSRRIRSARTRGRHRLFRREGRRAAPPGARRYDWRQRGLSALVTAPHTRK